MKPNETTVMKHTNNWGVFGRCTFLATLLALLTIAGTARAQVTNIIYQDSFARTGQLVGTAPDTVDFTGAKWYGGVPTNGIVTDGTEAALTNKLANNPWANAWLPLNVETGHVYTLSCSLYGNANDNQQWLAMGFATAPGQANAFNSGNVGAAWLLSRCSNNGCQFFGGMGTGNGATPTTLTYGGLSTFMNYSIVLNTATNPVRWSVTYYTNGVYASTYAYASWPNAENGMRLGYVGLGETSNARGNYKNFSVTDVVPVPTAPTILEQPNNLTAKVGHTATFWVNAIGLPDPTYQWMTNSTGGPTNAIVGATNASYTTPPLSMAYNGLNYSVALTTVAGSTNSALAALTVSAGQPTVFSATKTTSPTNVVVMFSGPIDPVTGLNTANYALQINGAPGGVSIIGASAGSVPGSVVLQTSTLNANSGYYLAVQNVQDQFGDTMNTSTNPVLPAGLVVYLRGDSGVQLDGNNNVAQWLDQTTNGNNAVQYFGMSINLSSLYIPSPQARPSTGTIGVNNTPSVSFSSGGPTFMTVPYSPSLAVNGNQTLYCFANPTDFSVGRELFNENVGNLPGGFDFQVGGSVGTIVCQLGDGSFNLNASSGGAALVGTEHLWGLTSHYTGTNTLAASATPVTNATSFFIDGQPYGVISNNFNINAPGSVYAGKPLYIGYRQDHFASAVMNGQMGEIMMYNTPLSGADRTNVDNYFGQKYYSFSITANLPATTTSSNGFSVIYSIGASQGPLHLNYQWQVNGTNIPGANGPTYTTPVLGPANSNTTYDVTMTLPNGTIYSSATNTLTVLPAPPYVASAGIPLWEATGSTNIVVLFDQAAIDPTTATTVGNYSLNNGASVLSAAMGLESNKVVLTTTPLTAWNANPGNYSLTVSNVQDLYGQTNVTAASAIGIYPAATAMWLESGVGLDIDSGNSSYVGVDVWYDQSGNGDNLFQPNGAPYEPLVTTNANGHGIRTVQFSGTNVATKFSTFMYSSNPTNGNPDYPNLEITGDMSVFAVVNYSTLANGTNGEIVNKNSSVSPFNQPAPYDYYYNAANALYLRGNGTNNGGFTATNAAAPSLGFPHVLAVNEAGTTVSHFLDAAPIGTGVLGNSFPESSIRDQAQPLYIGYRADAVNRLNGSLSELIVIGQAVDSNDLVAINNYLASKYFIPTGSNTFPVITQQPAATANVDQNTTLIVPAAATGNPLYVQWFDTNNIAQAGQTNATLTISNIQTSDSFYLLVTNIFGAQTSSVVNVTVYSNLTVSLGPPTVTLYTNQSYTFTAQAFGTVPIYYQWYQGASLIPNATNASYTTVATLGSINYSCTVTNPFNGYSTTNAGPVTLTGITEPTNAFSQTLISDGPVAYWRLNETAGSTIAYDYVGGYNGLYGTNTTNGLPGVPFVGASGQLGVAMDNTAPSPFTNGFISTPGLNLYTNSVTLLCWVLPFTNQFNPSGLIFCRTGTNVFGSQVGGGETLAYTWNNNPATYQFGAAGVVVTTNIWSLAALVITPANATLYIFNSALNVSAANNVANPPQSFAGGLAIGADQQGFTLPQRIFNGEMDEAAVFNYALSFGQLQQLYNAATVPVANPNPTNIVFSVTNNLLYLSWPADHTGWQLQAQTNKTTVGISTNWANVSGTTTTNQVVIPINLTNGCVFYRLTLVAP